MQSPTHYAFIRYVLCETWPYYAYRPLRNKYPHHNRRQHRLGRLLFRLANHLQPQQVLICHPEADFLFSYIQAGCHKTQLASQGQLLVADVDSLPPAAYLAQALSAGCLLVITDIHRSRQTEQCWQALQQGNHCGTTFDIYYAGIVMPSTRHQKHHYLL